MHRRSPSGASLGHCAAALSCAALACIVAAQPAADGAPAAPPKTLTLSVTVVGGKPGKPITGARIFIRSDTGALLAESRTNIKGLAVIEGIPSTRLKFQVTATTDWQPQGAVIDLATLKAPPTLTFNLVAAPPAEPAR